MEIGLNEKQLAYLHQVSKIRFHLLAKTFLLPIAILIGLFIFFTWRTFAGHNLSHIISDGLILPQMILFGVPIVALLVIFTFYYWIRIVPLKKDIKLNSGEQLDFKIIRKTYFPITNECFFFFEELDIPNMKIDKQTFASYDEGSYFYIYRGLHSEIVFENYMRFDIF